MIILTTALMLATPADDDAWDELRTRIESAPQEVATFIERRTGCNHFDGEVGRDYSEREQQIQNVRRELRCDEIDVDERALRVTHSDKPDVLQLLDDTKDLMPW